MPSLYNTASGERYAHRAKQLLRYYLQMVAGKAGLKWDEMDNNACEELIDNIIAAAIAEAGDRARSTTI
jgi:hypothetical protein